MDVHFPDEAPVSTLRRLEILAEGQRRLVELMAREAPLGEVLDGLCSLVESEAPGTICSVLLMDPDGMRLRDGAGPSLPVDYRRRIDGVAAGAAVGSCGTAAHRRETVVVEDIATDPLWADYRELALPRGLAACASTPVFGGGQLLGTFAIYHREPGPFKAEELSILGFVNGLAALAISRQRRIEAMQEQMDRLSQAQRMAHLGFWTWRVSDNQVNWSEELYRIYGLEPGGSFDASFEGYLERVHPEDRARVQALIRQAVEAKQGFGFEERILRPDGEQRWLRSQGTLVLDAQGRVERLVGVCLDITELHEASEALRQAQKLESLGLLAGNVAHDFNNILTAMLGSLEMARSHTPVESKARPYLAKVERSVARAADLARQMLAYSGRGRFVVRPLDLNAVAEEWTHLLSASLPKKVRLRLELSPSLPAVDGDATQIQQVIMNLVINAAEAIGEAEGAITLRTGTRELQARDLKELIPQGERPPGPYVSLEVEDTGQGMAPEVLARVFDPFFTTKPSGRGLGLSAMLGILRGHGAGLKLASEPGLGTRFTLFFPASRAFAAEAAAPAPEDVPLPGGMVLLVDDEPEIRDAAADMLRFLGFEVLAAGDGKAGLQRLRELDAPPALVLMDLSMPGMDGREALGAMRALRPGLKAILCSGFDERDALPGSAEGASFLQKPYRLEELRRALREALR